MSAKKPGWDGSTKILEASTGTEAGSTLAWVEQSRLNRKEFNDQLENSLKLVGLSRRNPKRSKSMTQKRKGLHSVMPPHRCLRLRPASSMSFSRCWRPRQPIRLIARESRSWITRRRLRHQLRHLLLRRQGSIQRRPPMLVVLRCPPLNPERKYCADRSLGTFEPR